MDTCMYNIYMYVYVRIPITYSQKIPGGRRFRGDFCLRWPSPFVQAGGRPSGGGKAGEALRIALRSSLVVSCCPTWWP